MRTIPRRFAFAGSGVCRENTWLATGPLDYPIVGAVGISQGDASRSSDRRNVEPRPEHPKQCVAQ